MMANPFSQETFPATFPAKGWKRSWIIGIIVSMAGMALAFGSLYFSQHLRRERLRNPRNPYPPTQNGLTLLAVHGSDYVPFSKDAQGRRNLFTSPTVEVALLRGAKPFYAGAHSLTGDTLTGDTFSLKMGSVQTLDENLMDSMMGLRHSVIVDLPQSGVPATYQWLDVTLEDRLKRRGMWRVYGLPHMECAILPPAPRRENQRVHGNSLQARAWWNNKPALDSLNPAQFLADKDFVVGEVRAAAPSSALSRPTQSWSIQIQSFIMEWELAQRFNWPFKDNDIYKGFTNGPLPGASTSYAKASVYYFPTKRIARIKANLVQYDATAKTVIFHNLPLVPFGKGRQVAGAFNGSTFLTAPSGVRITLQAPRPSPPLSSLDNYGPNDMAISCHWSPVPQVHPLSSPHTRDTTKSSRIMASVVLDENAYAEVENNPRSFGPVHGGNDAHILGVKHLAQPVLPKLTLSIVHQTELQSVPVSFTVPIRAGKPNDEWNKR